MFSTPEDRAESDRGCPGSVQEQKGGSGRVSGLGAACGGELRDCLIQRERRSIMESPSGNLHEVHSLGQHYSGGKPPIFICMLIDDRWWESLPREDPFRQRVTPSAPPLIFVR